MAGPKKTSGAPVRREMNDIPKQFYISWDLLQWSEEYSDRQGISYAEYLRRLIDRDRKRVIKLSQTPSRFDRGNLNEILMKMIAMLKDAPEVLQFVEWLLNEAQDEKE